MKVAILGGGICGFACELELERNGVVPTGKVNKFKVGNVLLAGRAAGLMERILGCGGFEAFASGTLAARAILNGDDYDKSVSAVDALGVKQIIYNTGIGFTDMVGKILKFIQK